MSVNKLISIKTPILDAIMDLGIDHMQDVPIFTRWASLAEKEINSYFQYQKKRTVLDINHCTANLPDDCCFLQRAVLGDLGEGCDDLFASICSQVTMESTTLNASSYSPFLVVDTGSGYTQNYGSVPGVVQDNKFIFNHDYDGKKLTIQYLGQVCDEEGFVKISQNHVQAITWYIKWKYFYRMRKINSLDYGKMNKAEQEWHRECANARAKDGVPTEGEVREMVAMLWDPYIGQGLGVGMFSTLSNTFGW